MEKGSKKNLRCKINQSLAPHPPHTSYTYRTWKRVSLTNKSVLGHWAVLGGELSSRLHLHFPRTQQSDTLLGTVVMEASLSYQSVWLQGIIMPWLLQDNRWGRGTGVSTDGL